MTRTKVAADLLPGDVFLDDKGDHRTVTYVGASRDGLSCFVYDDAHTYATKFPAGHEVPLVRGRGESMAAHPAGKAIPVYPVGTRIGDVKHFDRGMKVAFHCPKHPKNVFSSKDPFSSSWFGEGVPICDCNTRDYVVFSEYKPTRNG